MKYVTSCGSLFVASFGLCVSVMMEGVAAILKVFTPGHLPSRMTIMGQLLTFCGKCIQQSDPLLVGRQEGHLACKNWMLVCCW